MQSRSAMIESINIHIDWQPLKVLVTLWDKRLNKDIQVNSSIYEKIITSECY